MNTISSSFPTPVAAPGLRALASAPATPAAPQDGFQPGARAEVLGYNPTVLGGATMLAGGILCSAGILAAAAALIPGGAGLAGGSALAAGLLGMGGTGVLLSKHAASRYQATGQGTAFMTPAFQKSDLGPLAILNSKE